MAETTSTTRRVTRRKTASATDAQPASLSISPIPPKSSAAIKIHVFDETISVLNKLKSEYEALEKEIGEMNNWVKEQEEHKEQVSEEREQEKIAKSREEETYQYETDLKRRKVEDEFEARKREWETQLAAEKEERTKEKKELEDLRRRVMGFEEEKEKAIKDAATSIQKDLTAQFNNEKELSVQKHASEVALLKLKIENLQSDNERQRKEIDVLKSQIMKATEQVKEIAIQVVEARRPIVASSPKSSENTSA